MFRTDLAIENKEMYDEKNDIEIRGVEVDQEQVGSVGVTRIKITNENGSQALGKPLGNYITLEIKGIRSADPELKDEASVALSKELSRIIDFKDDLKVLVVGIGNEKVTPDALGPLVVSKVKVTRHFFVTYKKEKDETMACVSALIPGVMGTTGIETVEILKGAVEKVKPDIIIAVDALAARRMERINTTIQITDTGVSPGAGVGNSRMQLNGDSLGVRVIAIGVPTVIDSFTMVFDTIEELGESEKENDLGRFFKKLSDVISENTETMQDMLASCTTKSIVTANDIDQIVQDFSQIISNSINMTLHPGLDLEDVNRYMN